MSTSVTLFLHAKNSQTFYSTLKPYVYMYTIMFCISKCFEIISTIDVNIRTYERSFIIQEFVEVSLQNFINEYDKNRNWKLTTVFSKFSLKFVYFDF